MYRVFLALFVMVATTACSNKPSSTAELTRQGPDNVAIDGYSPVSYFTKGVAEKGDPEFSVSFEGVSYWLADADQAEQFSADPGRYAPAHRGWCSLMLTGSGNLAVANPESFKIVDDRLLLFWSGDFKGQSIDGLGNWQSKFEDDQGEATLLSKADNAWSRLLSGSKTENVVFFNPGDAERVNASRREEGKNMYE